MITLGLIMSPVLMLLQGHVGSSAYGVSLLEEESMVPELIRLAEECGVFSIRGYAVVCLSVTLSAA